MKSAGISNLSALARNFEAAIRRTGVRRIRLHDARHTATTVLIGRGVHPNIFGDLMGDSSTSITMDRYSHVAQDLQKEATDVFDQIDQTPKPTKKSAK
jgi:integrase